MTRLTCDEIADRLVDYADGELPDAESAEVAAHTARCERCRRQLAALGQSLVLAQVIWNDNEADLAAVAPQPGLRITRPHAAWRSRRRVAAIAAAAVLLATVGLYHRTVRQDVPAAVQRSESPTVRELELQIARAGIAMQLVAAADILAEQPGGGEFACERYRYVVATYPDTEAALQCKSRLASFCEERNGT
ncbi:MAG: zf-HC2 domain-containing protein [Planctomycetes bacterium]|nr:zf-HC2 domain-containing protein [Planctomycetota bacterium]